MIRVRITFTELVILEKGDLQGRDINQVIEEWFGEENINHAHASRDFYTVGNTKRMIKYEINPKDD